MGYSAWMHRVFIGWDPQEAVAWEVARESLMRLSSVHLEIESIALSRLGTLYHRETRREGARLFDVVSDAPMSTEHAIARFFIPLICPSNGWVVFTDGDVLLRRDIAELYALADERYALMVVQHQYAPPPGLKKDGAIQLPYFRKNWSSVMLMNLGHPAWLRLTLGALNQRPGRDLHRFFWLEDHEIGALPEAWNWLAGHSSPAIDPAIVHFTEGLPDKPGYEHTPYAAEWREVESALAHVRR